jgi:glycosyltransferase involved in cell wall biosynthesis
LKKKKLVFTVTNDLSFDQRMIRICSSLALDRYDVTLVGRTLANSVPFVQQPFRQVRLNCLVNKGKFFYLEYNLRLLFFLLFNRIDLICAIDLDTILPCLATSAIKRIPRVYDAHELFCEMQEIVERPAIYRIWKKVEEFAVPKFRFGYTVNQPIVDEFKRMYGVRYEVIRSISVLREFVPVQASNRYILYQGSVNEGRSFETLIPAMKDINAELWICGDGNFLQQTKELVRQNGLEQKVIFKGRIPPAALLEYTRSAAIGLTLFEKTGFSNYLSLANRFFDYMHSAVPQVCVDYPAYAEINNKHEIAVLIHNLKPQTIAAACNRLLEDQELHKRLSRNCLLAREKYNWQQEEKKLLAFYHSIC